MILAEKKLQKITYQADSKNRIENCFSFPALLDNWLLKNDDFVHDDPY